MRSKLTSLFLLSVLCVMSAAAQENTLVYGRLSNLGLVKEIEIKVNEKYLNNELVVYTAEVLDDGYFAFPVAIHEPQLVTLTYSNNKTLIYLEPNDSLEILADAGSFPYATSFGGKGGANNNYLLKYYEENPSETNEFNLKQYRSGGTYWYINTPQMDEWMQHNSPAQFTQKMNLRKETALSNFEFFVANNPGLISPKFKEYLTKEIFYDWAYHLMLYGNVFKNKYGIGSDFFVFLDEVPLQSEQIGNYWYRQFLLAYLCYREVQGGGANTYASQYDLAEKIFVERPLAFLQSEMIVRGFRSNMIDDLLPKYWRFIDHNYYPYFDEKTVDVYYKVMRYAEGAPAPNFTLADADGKAVSLYDYSGKVIYLNFWASWCRPCMAKLEQLKAIQPKLEKEGVVFLNVSLDREKETWLNTLQTKNISGVQLMANGDIDSDIAKSYEIKILPQYYIIDKNGNFATKSTKHDLIEVDTILRRLNNQN